MPHKDLVPETSHDLILILTLGIAPRPRSRSQNMLRNTSFLDLKSHNFSHTILFFLKHVRPDSVDRASWPGTL